VCDHSGDRWFLWWLYGAIAAPWALLVVVLWLLF
jgi:hypothetical protein